MSGISIQETLLRQADALAEQLQISTSQVLEIALENLLARYADHPTVHQGDVYWVQPFDADIPHPHVVIQDDLLNHSRIHTVVACALTSNIQRVNLPGNVLLESGEANLTRQSVVEVSKVTTLNKSQLGDYIGTLSEARIQQILAGMRFVQSSFFD